MKNEIYNGYDTILAVVEFLQPTSGRVKSMWKEHAK